MANDRSITWEPLCNAADKDRKKAVAVYDFHGRKFYNTDYAPAQGLTWAGDTLAWGTDTLGWG